MRRGPRCSAAVSLILDDTCGFLYTATTFGVLDCCGRPCSELHSEANGGFHHCITARLCVRPMIVDVTVLLQRGTPSGCVGRVRGGLDWTVGHLTGWWIAYAANNVFACMCWACLSTITQPHMRVQERKECCRSFCSAMQREQLR